MSALIGDHVSRLPLSFGDASLSKDRAGPVRQLHSVFGVGRLVSRRTPLHCGFHELAFQSLQRFRGSLLRPRSREPELPCPHATINISAATSVIFFIISASSLFAPRKTLHRTQSGNFQHRGSCRHRISGLGSGFLLGATETSGDRPSGVLQGRRRCPCGAVHRNNTCGTARPTPRCPRGFPSSAK